LNKKKFIAFPKLLFYLSTYSDKNMKTFHKKIKLRNKEEALVGYIATLFSKRGKE